jgi:hypothetical protein
MLQLIWIQVILLVFNEVEQLSENEKGKRKISLGFNKDDMILLGSST